MVRYSLFTFFILLETLQIVYCGNDSLNLFNSKPRKKTPLNNSNPAEGKRFLLESDRGEESPGKKTIEKRRLLFNEGSPGGDLENGEFSASRQTNYTFIETDTRIPQPPTGFNNWENKQSISPFPAGESANSRSLPDFRLMQPNSNHNWNRKQTTDIFGREQSHRNEGKNIKQTAGSESSRRNGGNYFGSAVGDSNGNFHPGKNGQLLNGRLSMATFNEAGVIREQNYETGETKPDYVSHSAMNYHNRNPTSHWNPNFYRPEKGVIINFNTECPAPSQLNNQMVHKFIFTPKSSTLYQPDISAFQIPQSAFISTHRKPPIYYL